MTNLGISPKRSARSLDEAAWLKGIDFLLSMSLPGLEIQCPKCGQLGMPGPKWVQGPKVKPLYVFHRNGTDAPISCAINETEAVQVRKEVNLSGEDIKTLLGNGKAYVLFSGGMDSLCALHYLVVTARDIGREVTALHIKTGVGFPEVSEYVEEVCNQLQVKLEVIEPLVDFFTLAKKWGIPGVNSRWCCRELKIKPVMEFLDKAKDSKLVFDGIRGAESSVRAKYLPVWFHPSFNCLSVSPIFDWSDEEVRLYAAKKGLPTSETHNLGTSSECWCGAYKKRADFEKLYCLHPEIYNKLMELEESNKNGFTFVYEEGVRVTLRELEVEIRKTGCYSSSLLL